MLLCLEDKFNCTYVNKLQLIVTGEARFFKPPLPHQMVVSTDKSGVCGHDSLCRNVAFILFFF